MTIRPFQPGDDAAKVSIYNEAAADLPKFKPATLDEERRRQRGPDFDPGTRLFALAGGRPVGYATFHANGRVSYPWCRKGSEGSAEALFEAVLAAMRQRGLTRAWAAYRADWPVQRDFVLQHGFRPARDMVNFLLDIAEMPTPAARASSPITPLKPQDLPAILGMVPGLLRVRTVAELEQYLFHNPYFPLESAFVLRHRTDSTPQAVGLVVANPAYANPRQVDAAMPCFRLGAFGTEGLQTKRMNGLFSFLAPEGRDVKPVGLDLMGYAALQLQDTEVETFSAQVPSDAGHLFRFYKQYFRQQGSFPVFERDL